MKHLPRIVIEVIPHKHQRYPTAGDYYKKDGGIHFKISKLNADEEFLIAIHELLEWYLITKARISIKEIDAFDIAFENAREAGNIDEPGDDPDAPYRPQHQLATMFEKLLAMALDVDWGEYEEHVLKL